MYLWYKIGVILHTHISWEVVQVHELTQVSDLESSGLIAFLYEKVVVIAILFIIYHVAH